MFINGAKRKEVGRVNATARSIRANRAHMSGASAAGISNSGAGVGFGGGGGPGGRSPGVDTRSMPYGTNDLLAALYSSAASLRSVLKDATLDAVHELFFAADPDPLYFLGTLGSANALRGAFRDGLYVFQARGGPAFRGAMVDRLREDLGGGLSGGLADARALRDADADVEASVDAANRYALEMLSRGRIPLDGILRYLDASAAEGFSAGAYGVEDLLQFARWRGFDPETGVAWLTFEILHAAYYRGRGDDAVGSEHVHRAGLELASSSLSAHPGAAEKIRRAAGIFFDLFPPNRTYPDGSGTPYNEAIDADYFRYL